MGDTTREAFAEFERLLALEPAARTAELERLRQSQAALYPQVAALLEAGRQAEAAGFLEAPATPPGVTRADPHAPVPGAMLGPYRLERPLGSGGMGEVWLAARADGRYAGQVAIKLLHAVLAHGGLRERFAREGELLARLSHPNIARLLDAGVSAEGVPYLVLEHVAGERLDRWCEKRRLGAAARVRLFLGVCDAVTHAHANLVVHRDLKPSNILVTADGTPKLLDFGIAKLLETESAQGQVTELTRLGGRALTPEYAAPEQIRGEPVTTATDVYSLGVVLYALLSGRRPYGEELSTPHQLERAVLETDPRRLSAAAPSERRRMLRGDLDNILAKALRKLPAERYASVDAFADDLRRYLDFKPVAARPDSFGYRARKFVRRNRLAVAASAAVALAIVAGVAATLWQAQRAQTEAQRAVAETMRLERLQWFLYKALDRSSPAGGRARPLTLPALVDDILANLDNELPGEPVLQARLLSDLGSMMSDRMDFVLAERVLMRALALAKGPAAGSDVASQIHMRLGMLREYQGRHEEAVRLAQAAVELARPLREERPDVYYGALAQVAGAMVWQGRTAEGAPLAEEVLAVARSAPGVPADFLAASVVRLGGYRLQQQRFDEADALASESIAIVERELGPDSPIRLFGLITRSHVAAARSDPVRADALATGALAAARRLLGKSGADNFYLAHAIYVAGQARMRAGRGVEGEALLRDAIAMMERLQGEFVAVAYVPLVENLRAQQRHADALAAVRRILSTCATLPRDVMNACASLEAAQAALLRATG
jgi:eukaryotic-like serine/threonine-protein kinase